MGITEFILLILVILPGFLTWSLKAVQPEKLSLTMYLFFSVVTSLSYTVVTGMILGIVGIFSVFLLAITENLIFILILFVIRYRSGVKTAGIKELFVLPTRPGFNLSFKNILITGFIILLILLYFQPAEYIIGGFDPGIYTNSGINLAETGSFLFYDYVLREMDFDSSSAYLGMFSMNPLGLSELDRYDGKMASQFYPGLPVWYAVSYKMFGYKNFLNIQPFFALLALMALFLLVREVFNSRTAWIAVVLYSINIITVWFGRFPIAEPLTVLLISTSVLLLLRFHETGRFLVSFSGGLLLAAALLTRPDAALVLVGLAGIYYFRALKSETGKYEYLYYLTAVGGFVMSLIYAVFFTGGYLRGLFLGFVGVSLKKETSLFRAGLLGVLLIFISVILIIGLKRRESLVLFLNRFKRYSKFIPTTIAAAFFSLILFQFFIRPALPFAFLSPHDNSLLRLGWYFAPLGAGWETLSNLPQPWKWFVLHGLIFMGALAVVHLLERSRDMKKWVFNLLWIPFALLYFQHLRIETVHIWLNRRYMMFILFVFITAIAFALDRFMSKEGRHRRVRLAAAGAMIFIIAGSFLSSLALIADHADMRGMRRQIGELNEFIPANSFIIIDDSPPHTLRPLQLPLKTRFKRDIAILKNSSIHLDSLPEMCRKFEKDFNEIVFLSPHLKFPPPLPGMWEYLGTRLIEYETLETPDLHDYRPPSKFIQEQMPVHLFAFMSERRYKMRSTQLDIGNNDDHHIAGDWYNKERIGGYTFRWTGERAEINLARHPGADKLVLTMSAGARVLSSPPEVIITIDNSGTFKIHPDREFREYSFPVSGFEGNVLKVTIETNTWKASGDGRALGVMVSRVEQK